MRYVAWISAEAARLGYDVRLATSELFFEHPLFREIQAGCGGNIEGIPLGTRKAGSFKGVLGYKFHYHRMFSTLYERLKERGSVPDYIMVPYLDYLAHATALAGSPFGDTPWGGLFINPHFHLKKMGVEAPYGLPARIKEKLFSMLLSDSRLACVFTFDELLLRFARENYPALAQKIHLLPEPAALGGGSSREEARRKLSVESSETVLLIYGVIDGSKNLAPLLESSALEEFPEHTSLLVAGTQNSETKSLLSSPLATRLRDAGRLRELDGFLHGPEEHDAFLASDIVWVGYKGQYISSGVLLQAGMASLPVIACKEGLIGWLSENHGLGLTINPNDPQEIAAAVSKLSRDTSLAAKLAANGREHSSRHTAERFAKTLGEKLPTAFPAHARTHAAFD